MPMKNEQIKNKEIDQEKPPILSSWKRLYTVVLLNLVLLIVLFYLFTKAFD
jgi:sugar phosphate permease